jgi:phosphatidylethanolamine/phosphatidyl-N-methylethanolamine N-methyltransferase
MEGIGSLVTGIALMNALGLSATALLQRADRQDSLPDGGFGEPESSRLRRLGDGVRFLAEWARAPLRVAAVAPSGSALARIMTREISGATGPVIELGPGTGPFTRQLLSCGVREADLTLVESGRPFAEALRAQFPSARILCMDAASVATLTMPESRLAGAVVSGLPLLSMSRRQITMILKGSFEKLSPTGAFYQFTYGPRCPVPDHMLARLGLEQERIGGTFANIPPAAVYRIRRIVAPAQNQRSVGLG